MLERLVSDGTVTLIAAAALAIELFIAIFVLRRRAFPLAPFVANLFSGLFLILALRAALVGTGAGAVAMFLGLGFVAHLFDVASRLRR